MTTLNKKVLQILLLLNGLSIIVAIDQIIKYKIRHSGGFYICNYGISFSFPISFWLFWLIFTLFFLASFFYLKKLSENRPLSIITFFIFSLILGGALSNGVDRLFLGCIVDFISIKDVFFPVFNPADIAIFLGGLLFLGELSRKPTKTMNKL